MVTIYLLTVKNKFSFETVVMECGIGVCIWQVNNEIMPSILQKNLREPEIFRIFAQKGNKRNIYRHEDKQQ